MTDLAACAEDFLQFCETYGIKLYPWQVEAFGGATKRVDGHFLHRLGGISVPRGDGKSWGAAAVGLWRLVMAPPPALILSEALDTEGAKVTLHHGRALRQRHPDLRASIEVLAEELRTSTGSRWLIRSRDHESSRGLHPDVVLYDEASWSRDDGELFASLLAGQASCPDPLLLIVSTVGRRAQGPLWKVQELAKLQAERLAARALLESPKALPPAAEPIDDINDIERELYA